MNSIIKRTRLAAICTTIVMIISILCMFATPPANAAESDGQTTVDTIVVPALDGVRTVNGGEDSLYLHLGLQDGDTVTVQGSIVTIANHDGRPILNLSTQLPEDKKITYDPLAQELSITNTGTRIRRCTDNKVAIWTARTFGGLAVCAPLTFGTGGNPFVGAACGAGVEGLVSSMTC